jgi:hypothetical protein
MNRDATPSEARRGKSSHGALSGLFSTRRSTHTCRARSDRCWPCSSRPVTTAGSACTSPLVSGLLLRRGSYCRQAARGRRDFLDQPQAIQSLATDSENRENGMIFSAWACVSAMYRFMARFSRDGIPAPLAVLSMPLSLRGNKVRKNPRHCVACFAPQRKRPLPPAALPVLARRVGSAGSGRQSGDLVCTDDWTLMSTTR